MGATSQSAIAVIGIYIGEGSLRANVVRSSPHSRHKSAAPTLPSLHSCRTRPEQHGAPGRGNLKFENRLLKHLS